MWIHSKDVAAQLSSKSHQAKKQEGRSGEDGEKIDTKLFEVNSVCLFIDSDHNLLVAEVQTRLKAIKKAGKRKPKWNLE